MSDITVQGYRFPYCFLDGMYFTTPLGISSLGVGIVLQYVSSYFVSRFQVSSGVVPFVFFDVEVQYLLVIPRFLCLVWCLVRDRAVGVLLYLLRIPST